MIHIVMEVHVVSLRAKLFAIVGLVTLGLLVSNLPWERQSSGITQVLYQWGEEQEDISDRATQFAVSSAEGSLVGEHQVDGSNWSIPNIIRHWLGG